MIDDPECKSVCFDFLDVNPTNFIQNVPCFKPFNCFNNEFFSQYDESCGRIISCEDEGITTNNVKQQNKGKAIHKSKSIRNELDHEILTKKCHHDEKLISKLENKIKEVEGQLKVNMLKMKREFDTFCKYILSLINSRQDTVKSIDNLDSSTNNYYSNNQSTKKINLVNKDLACLSASEDDESPESKVPVMKISK